MMHKTENLTRDFSMKRLPIKMSIFFYKCEYEIVHVILIYYKI